MTFLQENKDRTVIIASRSLEEEIISIIENYEMRNSECKSSPASKQVLQMNMSSIESFERSSWNKQFCILFRRRSRLVWLKPRNIGLVISVYFAILI